MPKDAQLETGLGLGSIKELAKGSRQALSTAFNYRSSHSSGREGSSHNDQVIALQPETPRRSYKLSSITSSWHSKSSSLESNKSENGYLPASPNQPTTPAPFHHVSRTAEMGQDASTLKRRRLREKKSKDAFSDSPPKSKDTSLDASPEKLGLEPAYRTRSPSVQVPIPRRRSSLTALHLDSSQTEKPTNNGDALTHRASTLTSTYKQDTKSQETITPFTKLLTRDTLQAPQQSHRSGQRQSVSSGEVSSNASIKPTRIYLPKTFSTPIATPIPPITQAHRKCYQLHRKMTPSINKTYRVPCMTCGGPGGEMFWACVWCYLRICEDCHAEFSLRGRNLNIFLPWLADRKTSPQKIKDHDKIVEMAGNQPLERVALDKASKDSDDNEDVITVHKIQKDEDTEGTITSEVAGT